MHRYSCKAILRETVATIEAVIEQKNYFDGWGIEEGKQFNHTVSLGVRTYADL